MTQPLSYDLLWQIAMEQMVGEPLTRLDGVIDWEPVARLLQPVEAAHHARLGGPAGYAPLALARALLLGEWYGLGFERLARALRLRLDFALFCGFDPLGPTPSAPALCRARRRLGEPLPKIRSEIDAQLDRADLDLTPAHGALSHIRLRNRHV